MAAILEKLGVPKDVRLFFKPFYTVEPDGSLRFYHGEHFGRYFHLVGNAVIPWRAGNGPFVFIAFSAMECLAFLSLNRFRYHDLSQLSFIALGTNIATLPTLKAGKIMLLFGTDLLGRLTDVSVANRLNGKDIAIIHTNDEQFRFKFRQRSISLPEDLITLNAVEKGLGLRNGIRTLKPRSANSFLEQLLNSNV